LADDEACQRIAKEYDASADYQRLLAQYQSDLAKWQVIADKAKADGAKLPAALRKPLRGGERSGKIGNLYEAHIRPFVSFGIRGVLWDQGESGTAVTGVDQYALMGALIRGWRNEWGQGEFPFLYVQKPSGLGCVWDGSNPTPAPARKAAPLPGKVPTDGQDRETYVRIMTYPQTAMVTDSDLGSGTHPTNKSGYGERAGRVALGMAYGRKLEIYGPVYKSHVVEGNKIRVTFEHTGQGLAFQHGEKLQGFAIAGEDGAFEWATALIDGNSVIVSSAQVSKPVAVRYAWSTQIPWANLFNRDGLPALTFRTDSW
jgi:sialate O-acetylesterase